MEQKYTIAKMLYDAGVDIIEAIQYKKSKDFALENGTWFYDIGSGGVWHQVMMEKGFAAPGRLIAGADSHTNTYGALSAISTGIGSTEAGVIFATGKMWFKIPVEIADRAPYVFVWESAPAINRPGAANPFSIIT